LRQATTKTLRSTIVERGRSIERRQLTVMFCDLVGSTPLFAELDPEDISQVLRSYFRCCADRIEAAGGFVAQYQGDAVLGYFGYTEASETSAEQAVRAALEILEPVAKIQLPSGRNLQVRIGIATGIAVVGDPSGEGTRLEQGAVGEALHLAARLQALAPPSGIVIAESTKRLTGRLFGYRDLGKQSLKGFREQLQLWQVLGLRSNFSQFKVRRTPLLTQIVDREVELEILLQSWRQAAGGHARIVCIVGEAGIGKSRLINEFRHKIRRDRHLWLEGGGAPSFQNTPFYAIAQTVKRALDPAGRASPIEFRSRLEHVLGAAGIATSEVAPLLLDMLKLSTPGAFSAPTTASAETRNRLFSSVRDWLRASAQRRPLVIALEDLHWIDSSSLELLGFLIDSVEGLPVLTLLSMRPEFRPQWPFPSSAVNLSLARLTDDELRRIVYKVRRTAALLTDEDVAQVVKRADGVPLFGIELARFLGEQHARAGDREIPITLADLLMARLDQLGPAKGVAQIAAVIGDEIPPELLAAVSEISPGRLRRLLLVLKNNGVLRQERRYASLVYTFTHSLLRDAAYDTLLKASRRQLHRRAGTVIADKFREIADSRPEVLAHHWTSAEEYERAASEWERAGEVAASPRAFTEAEQSYRNAVSALMRLPASRERDAKELALRSSLAGMLRITRGFSAQQTIEATARARALADRNGDRAQQFRQMWGEWTAASSGGDHPAALKLANQFYRLAIADGGIDSLAHAHMMEMTSRYRVGDLIGAEDYFVRGEEFFGDPDFQQRPGVIAQTYGNAALIAWIIGGDAAAQLRIDHALATARTNNNPYDLACARCMASIHFGMLDRFELAVDFAKSAIALSDEHTFPQFAAISRVGLGRALAGLGFTAEGTKLMREGLARMAGTSVRVAITRYTTWLAEELLRAGSFDEAFAAAEDALRINPQELFFRPETLRLRGEIHLRASRPDQAERDFLEALALANRMGAKRFRERAMRSLQQLIRNVAA
jgi:class 3 adenylate cyclase/tetratricopeptide (TPR) repeat protein